MVKNEKFNKITEGPLLVSILSFFFPIFMGSLLQQSYNFVDALIIGRFAGAGGLAAIDATYNYMRLLINVFLSISVGATILISQYIGAKNEEKASKVVHVIIVFALIGGAVITLVGLALSPTFSSFMNVPDAIFDMCVGYLRVYFLGTIFSFVFNIGSGILRAGGDTKKPFIFLMISSGVNILLDLLLVAGLGYGVTGAAAATVISQFVACIFVINHLKNRSDCLALDMRKLHLDKGILGEIMKVGLPLGGQTSLYVTSNMIVQRGINAFGVVGIAAWSICGKMDFVIWLCIDAIGITVTTFVAQNYGALNKERMNASSRYGLVIILALVGLISTLFYMYVPVVASWFTRDVYVIKETTYMMRIIAPFYILPSISQVISANIKGTGETLKPMVLTLFGTCAVRVLWILFVLPQKSLAITAVFSYPVSWGVTVVLFILLGRRCMRRVHFEGEFVSEG